ncbi:rhodoquinone biosynthesis methyltransferase RquA [Terasakiella sp. SH-1]|uniref:rhodoquinone biosynthesis methyltransferase RquA n=1 Tax=Terasakiella sp. SH-1 TaxID=2560057 RepID=UPI001073D8F1|nr:rhodoquinone biosynthesis methyltransferase RquA [Terasakiella sp. SH-1]
MGLVGKEQKEKDEAEVSSHSLPTYLQQTYSWAYLNPKTVPILSSSPVVSLILWGNAGRLIKRATMEVEAGETVLQAAAVYGPFSTYLADAVGPTGQLDIIDIAPIQVETTRKRVGAQSHVHVALGDAAIVQQRTYDTVVCFFLLHEVPDEVKTQIVHALLSSVKKGGKVVFVDYHKPSSFHPLKPVMSRIFDWLEPYAKGLWEKEINAFAPDGMMISWHKETLFGGLYQKVVATIL